MFLRSLTSRAPSSPWSVLMTSVKIKMIDFDRRQTDGRWADGPNAEQLGGLSILLVIQRWFVGMKGIESVQISIGDVIGGYLLAKDAM